MSALFLSRSRKGNPATITRPCAPPCIIFRVSQMQPDLMSLLQGGGQGGPPQAGADPLSVLQELIQAVPSVMAALPDPKDTQDLAKVLLILTGVQSRLMGGQNGPPAA